MSLQVDYTKVTNAEEAYKEISARITEDKIKQFKVKADIDYDDDQKCVTATGKGFELFIRCHEDAVNVDLKLSLLLRAIKGKVLGVLEKELRAVV